MVEPNVKDGKGGLRDLHTLFWIAKYMHPGAACQEVLDSSAMFDRRDKARLHRGRDFLWTVRCHLHFLTGRPEERLTFDLQPEIARRMGYGDRGDAPAVERFMRRYFLVAKEVGALTRIFARQAGGRASKSAQGPVAPAARPPAASQAAQRGGLHEDGGRLDIDGPEMFEPTRSSCMRLFWLADERRTGHPSRRDDRGDPRACALITRRCARDAAGARRCSSTSGARQGPASACCR